ncbi:MAG: hypothetical protein WCI91_02620 [Candidatus Nomurabacteria bacterium]
MKNIYFFYGTECPHCIDMEKLVDKLISEGFEIKKTEVWHNADNENLMVSLDKGEDMCGGVPFFFNENSGKSICGEINYKDLKDWSNGK